jgi:hypothetical protein
MSGKMDGAGDAVMLVPDIIDNGGLSIANVMGNSIGKEMLSKLREIMRSKPNLVSLCGIADDATEADLSGLGMDADDAIILASELPDKGALLSLDISSNSFVETSRNISVANSYEAGDLVEYNGLQCPVEKAASDWYRVYILHGVVALADAIRDNRAMTSLNLADNNIGQLVMSDGWQYDEDADEYWIEVEGEEFVEKHLPAGEQLAIESPVGAIAIVNAIRDMRAMTSLNLASNSLGIEGAKIIADILPKCT